MQISIHVVTCILLMLMSISISKLLGLEISYFEIFGNRSVVYDVEPAGDQIALYRVKVIKMARHLSAIYYMWSIVSYLNVDWLDLQTIKAESSLIDIHCQEVPLDCNPGSTPGTSGQYEGCASFSAISYNIATSCRSNSIMGV